MNQMVLTPRVSEKSIGLAERGVYVFEVPSAANKITVTAAVEQAFNVKVAAVNMLIVKGKPTTRRYKGNNGNRRNLKKAMVTLKQGDKIALFEEGSK